MQNFLIEKQRIKLKSRVKHWIKYSARNNKQQPFLGRWGASEWGKIYIKYLIFNLWLYIKIMITIYLIIYTTILQYLTEAIH